MDRLVTLSKIVETLGPIKGEKTLQKMIYLADQYGERLGYNFTWNNYGPISFNLEQDIQELSMLGLISISQEDNVPVYAGTTSSTHLSPFWKKQVEKCQLSSNYQKLVQFFHGMGDKSKDPQFLEVLASLDYIQKHENDTSQLNLNYNDCGEDILTSAQQSLQELQYHS